MPALPRSTKIGYASGEVGIVAVEITLQLYLFHFFERIVGLEPALVGLALALPLLWDAITDPIAGILSDRTRSRFGRRSPYIAIGAVALAASFILLFHPPDFHTSMGKFWFLLLSMLLVNSAMTLLAVPHSALSGEIVFDRNERTEIFGWRFMLGNVGFLLGTLLPGLYLAWAPEQERSARQFSAWAISMLVLSTAAVVLLSIRRLDQQSQSGPLWQIERRRPSNLIASKFSLWNNRPFLYLILIYALSMIGRTLNSSIALYYYEFFLGLPEQIVMLAILGTFILVMSLAAPLWVLLGKRVGKKLPSSIGVLLLGIVISTTYPFLPPGLLWPPLIIAVVGGILAGSVIIIDSLIADVIDIDKWRTRCKREGLYFGTCRLTQKGARAGGLALTGTLLQWIGFGEDLSLLHREQLGWLFGPGVGSCFIVCAILLFFFPLSDQQHRRIQQILDKRNQKKND